MVFTVLVNIVLCPFSHILVPNFTSLYVLMQDLSQWKNLHFYRAAGHPINLILVERIKPMSSGQPFPPLWLAWVGARTLPLATVWFKYLRRFGVDHWYRFAHRNDCIGRCLI